MKKLNAIKTRKNEFFITILSLLIFSFNIFNTPIHAEFGLQNYIGQELIRGYPIFSTTVFVYPPMVYFIDAFWMVIFFFLPNYLAIRLGGMILGTIVILLFYKILKIITKNELLPVFSAMIFLSFIIFVEHSLDIATKPVMIFFAMLMFFTLFKKRYLLSGIFTCLGILTWQVGGIFLSAPISYYFLRREKRGVYLKFFIGLAIPLLLIVLYFLSNNLLGKFINYSFTYAISFKKEIQWRENTLFSYIKGWVAFCNTGLLFIFLGLIASLLLLFKFIHEIKNKTISKIINNKELFSFALPCLLLFLYSFVDFQAGEDVIPLMPVISLLSTSLLVKISKKIPVVIILLFLLIYGYFPAFQPVYPPNSLLLDAKKHAGNLTELFNVMKNYTFSEIVYYSLFHRTGWEMNLEQQLKLAEFIKNNTNENEKIFSLGAPELLFLSGRRNINDQLFLSSGPQRVYARNDNASEKTKNNIINEMPKFIVAWNVSNVEEGIKFLDIKQFLETNYKTIDLHPKYIIWKKKT